MLTQRCRLPLVCHYRCRICSLHDLQNRTPIRQEERPHLPVHLLNRRLHLRHVRQSFWHRSQTYFCWQ